MRKEIQIKPKTVGSVVQSGTEDTMLQRLEADIDSGSNRLRDQDTTLSITRDQHLSVSLAINGIHSESCTGKIETAVYALEGVAEVFVNVAARRTTVWYYPVLVTMEDIKAAVTTAGYGIAEDNLQNFEPAPACCEQTPGFFNPRACILGLLASFAIVGIYLAMNTLTSDWYFARVQFNEYRWWIISLAIGIGVQVALFCIFRAHLRGRNKAAANSSMATSGGVSAVAMMACCSHYLAALVPLLGISFLSATTLASIEQYQVYFFLAGIVSCLLGIGLMVHMMWRHGLLKSGAPKKVAGLNPGSIGSV
jgi:cation transport ATPase